ncbi:MAG: thioesterase family protein [Antarcticimicrobium sp.]|uniref:thioesterase family protein n=1 Tax=Antarcticimicrobium sp. TaxID=2824147 RepID=UPI00262CAE1B|nr:thioesterase family protein [Antarcticimicrobium sp.]MDF1717147.1 thioesterase family protein [Antarcticimicrobium sp.]
MNDPLDSELTHVSTIQTWECDSNAHLNVQFFHQRFREAGHLFRLRHGLPGTSMVSAHTRFRRELHVDDTATIFTLPVQDADGQLFLLHRLTLDGETLCCTSLDRLTGTVPGLVARPLTEIPEAAPRGLPGTPTVPIADTGALVASGAARITCITHVLPADMDHAGEWRAERLVSSFSNGGQSAWQMIGATTPYLRERNLGRVVVEMTLDRFASPAPGAVLRQTSRSIEMNEKTYRFGHQIEDAVTGTLYAAGEALSILMDLGSRKAVPIPQELRAPVPA